MINIYIQQTLHNFLFKVIHMFQAMYPDTLDSVCIKILELV